MKTGSMIGPACAGLAVVALSANTARADIEYGIEAGVGYSDNVRRLEVNETDETIGILGLDLAWSEQTRRLEGDATIDLSYLEYLDDTFDSEVVGTADGTLILGILPERFTWLFQDSFGQAAPGPFAPVTPENRENLNYFTTGPDLALRLGAATTARLFGRYSSTNYEDSPLDAERTSVGVSLGRQPSQSSELAINAVSESIDFDATGVPDPDYDQESAFLSYSLEGARTEVESQLGYTWLKPTDGDTSGGLLATLTLTRELSSSSTLTLDLGTQFTDASEALRGAIEGGSVGGPDINSSADPFEHRSASLRWDFARNRTGIGLGVGWSKDLYETQSQLDRKRMVYEVSFTRRLAPTLDASLLGVFNDEEYDNAGIESDEFSVIGRMNWRLGRNFSLALSVERSDRSTAGGGTGEYVDNRAFLTLTFRPATSSGPARGVAQ